MFYSDREHIPEMVMEHCEKGTHMCSRALWVLGPLRGNSTSNLLIRLLRLHVQSCADGWNSHVWMMETCEYSESANSFLARCLVQLMKIMQQVYARTSSTEAWEVHCFSCAIKTLHTRVPIPEQAISSRPCELVYKLAQGSRSPAYAQPDEGTNHQA